MTSRASCIRRVRGHRARPCASPRATASTSAIGRSAPVRTIESARGPVDVRDLRLGHRAEDSRLCSPPAAHSAKVEVRVLAFIDEIVIPFLNGLYGAVGYLGVLVAMAIESAMIPFPSELILPYAGFLVSDPRQIEPLTGQPGTTGSWCRRDDREHPRVARRVRHRCVRRPAVPRALR